LKNGEYTAVVYEKTAPVAVLPGCEIDLASVFGASEA
jgi:hypothetical protein